MAALMYVEVLGRGGEVHARHAVERFPVKIGRAYDNDIILDDAFVAPHHALLELDAAGIVTARDLGTKNALQTSRSNARVQSVVLDATTEVRLGHTFLRVRPLDFAVAPERKDQAGVRTRRGLALAALLAALIGLEAWQLYLGYAEQFEIVQLVSVVVALLVALVVWTGAWALATRLLLGRPRIIAHALIATSALAAISALNALEGYLAYAFSLSWLTRVVPFLIAAVAGWMLYAHLKLPRPRWKRLPAALAIVAATAGLLFEQLPQWMQRGRLPDPYLTDLKSPWVRVARARGVEQFFEHAAQTQQRADAARIEQQNEGGGNEQP